MRMEYCVWVCEYQQIGWLGWLINCDCMIEIEYYVYGNYKNYLLLIFTQPRTGKPANLIYSHSVWWMNRLIIRVSFLSLSSRATIRHRHSQHKRIRTHKQSLSIFNYYVKLSVSIIMCNRRINFQNQFEKNWYYVSCLLSLLAKNQKHGFELFIDFSQAPQF